ncbi:hypothetical protein KCU95_g9691, partial [Aureobasidium melanogenum]
MDDIPPTTTSTRLRNKAKINRRAAARKEKSPKDLIRIQNQLNGKTYKFACHTCIMGHRAPHCDPKKHFDKILFRRPEPGRPPRDCGHSVTPGCDCKASRELCCQLTKAQWATLQAGGVPVAVMYNSQRELEEAMKDAERQEFRAREQANMYAYQQNALPYRGPSPGMPFGFPDPMVQYNQYPPFSPQPPNQLGSISYHPAPTMFDHSGYQPQFQPVETHPPNQNTSMPMDNTLALQQFVMDMSQQEQMAAQPSSNPSQSCCSRKQAQPPPQSYVGATTSPFNLPGPAPRAQFPCQSCASYQCTCITCPEVRQVSSGAWSQSCGRGGHIDNMVLPKQEYSSFQESQGSFQDYEGLQGPQQDYQLMLSQQQHVQQSNLEAPQLALADQPIHAQAAYGSMPYDFSTFTADEISQAFSGFQDATHMSATQNIPVDFSNISEPMLYQHPSQLNGAEFSARPPHIQRLISHDSRVTQLSPSPEASVDNTIDPRNLRVRPQER